MVGKESKLRRSFVASEASSTPTPNVDLPINWSGVQVVERSTMSTPAPATTQQQQRQKLYRTLHDQIDLALYPQALRTVNKRQSGAGTQ